jgi:hypothetical protein
MTQQYDPGVEALQTTAAPNIQTVLASGDPRSSSAFRLAEALGKVQPALEQFQQEQEHRKTQEQMLKVDAYREQFVKDMQPDGAVTQAQVRERFQCSVEEAPKFFKQWNGPLEFFANPLPPRAPRADSGRTIRPPAPPEDTTGDLF